MAGLAPQHVPPDPPSPPVGARGARTSAARWRRQIFVITWIAYAGFYFVRQAFSVAKLGILDDPTVHTVLTERVLGVIDAVYLAAYAVGQFLWGMWADRFGPRVVVAGGMAGAIVASCLTPPPRKRGGFLAHVACGPAGAQVLHDQHQPG